MAKENNGQQATEKVSAEKANMLGSNYNGRTNLKIIYVSMGDKKMEAQYVNERTTRSKEPKTMELPDAIVANMQHGMEAYQLPAEEVVEDFLIENSEAIYKYVAGETEELALEPVDDYLYDLSKYLLKNDN